MADVVTTSISVGKDLLDLSRERARRERRSFSSQLATLLQADLVQVGWIGADGQLTETGAAALATIEGKKEAQAA